MNRTRSYRPALLALAMPAMAAGILALWAAAHPPVVGTAAHELTAAQRARLAGLTMPFIANRGQVNARVAYYASTFAGTAFVTRHGALVLALPAPPHGHARHGWALVETPVASRTVRARGLAPAPTRVSVFAGRAQAHWRRELPTYRRIGLGQPWPGISYAVSAHFGTVERMFTVAPGADATAIRIRVSGAVALRVRDRRLLALTGNGPVTLSRPLAWQIVSGRRRSVPVRFSVSGDTYGFHLGAHDARRPVVIDPVVRATYLGGTDYDAAHAMAVAAANGDVYLAGETTSTGFPGTGGGAQPANAGNTDAFVALLSPDLTQLIRATYLGGSGDDFARALALGQSGTTRAGDVYVAGDTFSTGFPGTGTGAQPACGGTTSDCTSNGDAFVALLSADLTTLIRASYLGGANIDDAHALAIAPAGTPDAGDVYVGGRTLSANFPQVGGGAQPSPANSSYDGFVSRFSPDLTTLLQSSYLGGTGADGIYALLVAGSSGNVYATGDTSSTDFPCTQAGSPSPTGGACAGGTPGAQPQLAGGFDAFVALFNPGLTGLTQATYLGGSDLDDGYALAAAPASSPEAGQVYVAGRTLSSQFPGVSAGAQPTRAGNYDGFVARLAANLQTLGAATYLGGSQADQATALALDAAGNVYVAGNTASSDFPCTTGTGPTPAGGSACAIPHAGAQFRAGGGTDGFVALLSPDLAQLSQATYLGGTSFDGVSGVGLGPSTSALVGDVYVAGRTQSTDLPATASAAQPAYAGTSDAYAAAMSPNLQGPEVQLSVSLSAPSQVTLDKKFQYTIVVTNNDPASGASATDVAVTDQLNIPGPGAVTYDSATSTQGAACSFAINTVTCKIGTLPPNGGSATVTVNVTAHTAGDVTNVASATMFEAPAAGATLSQTGVTTIKATSSSGGGGGASGPWSLLALGMLAGLVLARRRRA